MTRKNILLILIFIAKSLFVYSQQGKIKTLTKDTIPLDYISIFIPEADTTLLTDEHGEANFDFGTTTAIQNIAKEKYVNMPVVDHNFFVNLKEGQGIVVGSDGKIVGSTQVENHRAYLDARQFGLTDGLYIHKAGSSTQKFIVDSRIGPRGQINTTSNFTKSAQKAANFTFEFNHTDNSYFHIAPTSQSFNLDDAFYNDINQTIEPLPFLSETATVSGTILLNNELGINQFYMNIANGSEVKIIYSSGDYSIDIILQPNLDNPYEETLPAQRTITIGAEHERIVDYEETFTITGDTSINYTLHVLPEERKQYNIALQGLDSVIYEFYGKEGETLVAGNTTKQKNFSIDTTAANMELFGNFERDGYVSLTTSYEVMPGDTTLPFDMVKNGFLYTINFSEQNELDSIDYEFVGAQGEELFRGSTGNSSTMSFSIDTIAPEMELFGDFARREYIDHTKAYSLRPGENDISVKLEREAQPYSITFMPVNQHGEHVGNVSVTIDGVSQDIVDYGEVLQFDAINDEELMLVTYNKDGFMYKEKVHNIRGGSNVVADTLQQKHEYTVIINHEDRFGNAIEARYAIDDKRGLSKKDTVTITSFDRLESILVKSELEGHLSDSAKVSLVEGGTVNYTGVLPEVFVYTPSVKTAPGAAVTATHADSVLFEGVANDEGELEVMFESLEREYRGVNVTMEKKHFYKQGLHLPYTISPENNAIDITALWKQIRWDLNLVVSVLDKGEPLSGAQYIISTLEDYHLSNATMEDTKENVLLEGIPQQEMQAKIKIKKDGYLTYIDTILIKDHQSIVCDIGENDLSRIKHITTIDQHTKEAVSNCHVTILEKIDGDTISQTQTDEQGLLTYQFDDEVDLSDITIAFKHADYKTRWSRIDFTDSRMATAQMQKFYNYTFTDKTAPGTKIVGKNGSTVLFETTAGADSTWTYALETTDGPSLNNVKLEASLEEHHPRTYSIGTVSDGETVEQDIKLSHHVYTIQHRLNVKNQLGKPAGNTRYEVEGGDWTLSGTIQGSQTLSFVDVPTDTLDAVLRIYGKETYEKNIQFLINPKTTDHTIKQKTWKHSIEGNATNGAKITVVGEDMEVTSNGTYATPQIESVDSIANFTVKAFADGHQLMQKTVRGHGKLNQDFNLKPRVSNTYSFGGSGNVNGEKVSVYSNGKKLGEGTINNGKWNINFDDDNATLNNVVI